jgi:hypothetical protein
LTRAERALYVPRMLARSLTRGTLQRLAALVAVAAASLSFAAPAQAAQVTCPGTFHVLHDDRIGALQIAAGHYSIIVLDDRLLSCAEASDWFRQFLEDYDGRLPRPWVANNATGTFTRGRGSRVGFAFGAANMPSGGGSSGRHPVSGLPCPGYFRVLHDDRVGRLRVPAGQYRITLLAAGQLSCSRASSLFASFLQDFNGVLPRPWRLDVRTGTFSSNHNVGFRVKEAVGAPAQPTPLGRHPADGTRCPGFFEVQAGDRIGSLRLPAGNYIITTLRGGDVSCSEAADELEEFLDIPTGNLPRPWVLNARKGVFRERGTRNGFRVKRAG